MNSLVNIYDSNSVVFLKYWFFNKNHNGDYAEHFGLITKETEKAYKIILENGVGGSYFTWVPKSCTVHTVEEFNKEIESIAEQEAAQQKKWEDACNAYKELVAYAQKMGVKGVHEGLRKDTILRKMEQAGVALPA